MAFSSRTFLIKLVSKVIVHRKSHNWEQEKKKHALLICILPNMMLRTFSMLCKTFLLQLNHSFKVVNKLNSLLSYYKFWPRKTLFKQLCLYILVLKTLVYEHRNPEGTKYQSQRENTNMAQEPFLVYEKASMSRAESFL